MTVYSIASLRERRKEIIDDYQARLASCRTRYDELRAAVIREGRPLSDGVKGGRQVTRLNATLIQACRDLDRLEEEDLSALRDRRAEELGLIDAALVLRELRLRPRSPPLTAQPEPRAIASRRPRSRSRSTRCRCGPASPRTQRGARSCSARL